MLLRLLKLAARRPFLVLGLLLCALPVLLFIASAVASCNHADAAGSPRAVLGRAWFDRYPEKSTDEVQLWIWFGGGIGIHETGSYWRTSSL